MQTLKEFDYDDNSDGIMKDYDQDGNLIYEGNFDETLATFCPREGDGEEYDSEGNIIYNGEWQSCKIN